MRRRSSGWTRSTSPSLAGTPTPSAWPGGRRSCVPRATSSWPPTSRRRRSTTPAPSSAERLDVQELAEPPGRRVLPEPVPTDREHAADLAQGWDRHVGAERVPHALLVQEPVHLVRQA